MSLMKVKNIILHHDVMDTCFHNKGYQYSRGKMNVSTGVSE